MQPNSHSAVPPRSRIRAAILPSRFRCMATSRTVLIDLLEYQKSTPDQVRKGKLNWEQRLTAFVVRSEGEIVAVDLGPVAPIWLAVSAWRASLGFQGDTNRDAAVALR